MKAAEFGVLGTTAPRGDTRRISREKGVKSILEIDAEGPDDPRWGRDGRDMADAQW